MAISVEFGKRTVPIHIVINEKYQKTIGADATDPWGSAKKITLQILDRNGFETNAALFWIQRKGPLKQNGLDQQGDILSVTAFRNQQPPRGLGSFRTRQHVD